jgi:hypothetical protein
MKDKRMTEEKESETEKKKQAAIKKNENQKFGSKQLQNTTSKTARDRWERRNNRIKARAKGSKKQNQKKKNEETTKRDQCAVYVQSLLVLRSIEVQNCHQTSL